MKVVSNDLAEHLNTQKNLTACDLYEIVLANKAVYRFAAFDRDVIFDGKLYRHNAGLFKRQQIKLDGNVTVDSLNVSVYAGESDKIEGRSLIVAAVDGTLDRARLALTRCFFEGDAVLGGINLFVGKIEITSAGGLELALKIKAETQGLNMEFPMRRYYPQGSFTLNNNVVSSRDTDDVAMVTPFIPQREVLL